MEEEGIKLSFTLRDFFPLLPALRDVAGDHCVTAGLTFVISQEGKVSRCPEDGTVLAHLLALIVDVAFLERGAQVAPWGVLFAGLIQAKKRLAEDFQRAVSEKALCALVPGDDSTFKVDANDGVVPDATHQQPVLFFVFFRNRLGPGPTRDLGTHDEE